MKVYKDLSNFLDDVIFDVSNNLVELEDKLNQAFITTIRELIFSIDLDWSGLDNLFSIWEQKATEKIKSKEYQKKFEYAWFDAAPKDVRENLLVLVDMGDQGNKLAKIFFDTFISELGNIGLKIYQVRQTPFCANTEMLERQICTECKLFTICKLQKTI